MGGVKEMLYYSCDLGQSLFEFVAYDWLSGVLGLQYEDHVLELPATASKGFFVSA